MGRVVFSIGSSESISPNRRTRELFQKYIKGHPEGEYEVVTEVDIHGSRHVLTNVSAKEQEKSTR